MNVWKSNEFWSRIEKVENELRVIDTVVAKFATIFPRGVVVIWYWNWYWFLKVYADAPIQRCPYPYQKYFWKVERDE